MLFNKTSSFLSHITYCMNERRSKKIYMYVSKTIGLGHARQQTIDDERVILASHYPIYTTPKPSTNKMKERKKKTPPLGYSNSINMN